MAALIKPAAPAPAEAPAAPSVKGRTTEEVLRQVLAEGHNSDPLPVIAALVARFDARAAKRAKAEEDAG